MVDKIGMDGMNTPHPLINIDAGEKGESGH